jgi:hypothetical protein
VPTDSAATSSEKVIIQIEPLVRHLVEKLSELLIKSSTTETVASTPGYITEASRLLFTLTRGDIPEQKELLSRLLFDTFQSKIRVEVSTQVTNKNMSH